MSRLGIEIPDRPPMLEERRALAVREAMLERKARERRIDRATNRLLAFALTLSIVAVWFAIRFR